VSGPSVESPWSGWTPADLRVLLGKVDVAWWVSGGWAIDLFLGGQTRGHGDLDVSCKRQDADRLLSELVGWDSYAPVDGRLYPRRGRYPSSETHSFWCRPHESPVWHFELMLEEAEGAEWIFRRHSAIRRPFESILRKETDLHVLQPEIQLLYKAKYLRERDQLDFERVVPRLSVSARLWLQHALALVHPGHVWLAALEQ
jgi:Aminoglycoside-2''-adenylyltransferase